MSALPRIVIVCGEAPSQQERAGCWHRRLHDALLAAGATVTEHAWPAGVAERRPAAGAPTRLAWLPRGARGLLRAAYHRARTALTGPTQRVAVRRRTRLCDGADLVFVESPAVARLVAASGIPPQRLWLLATRPAWLAADDPSPYARALARAAPLLGGVLVNDEPARESVERALSTMRPRVELLPASQLDPGAGQRVARRLLADTAAGGGPVRAPRRVLISGYDLKFATDLARHLDRRADLSVTLDEWPRLESPAARTARQVRSADAIFAEWARPSAAWLSRHKRPGQLLVVRLHRYELDSPHPRTIAIEQVDAVVYIAPLFGRRIRDELGWPSDRLVYIPNYLDVDWLDRPKLPEARFTLGFVGIEVARKRFDLALDLLAALRREDLRYVLRVRSVLPWRHPYTWDKPEERAYAAQCFQRIEQDPLLRNGVIVDEPGRDMARWFRQVGVILSTSDEEGSHTAVAEGMASGAVPVVRSWPGADEMYGKEWLHEPGEDAVAAVLECADEQVWRDRAARASAEVRQSHDPAAVVAAWADLLHGDLAAARAHFESRTADTAIVAGQEGTQA